jgi:hypothetical protein
MPADGGIGQVVGQAVDRVWVIPQGDGLTNISFDAVVRESHSSELTITDNPLETGVVVSDHAFMQPLRLDIEGAVTDTWLHATDPQGRAVPDPFASSTSRSQVAWALLQDIQAAAEPFTLQTGLRAYFNMVIVSLSVDQDKDSAAALFFRASLREVILVSTQTVTYPPRAAGKTARQAAKKVTSGEKQPAQVTDPNSAATFLYQLTDPTRSLGDKVAAASKSLTSLVGIP